MTQQETKAAAPTVIDVSPVVPATAPLPEVPYKDAIFALIAAPHPQLHVLKGLEHRLAHKIVPSVQPSPLTKTNFNELMQKEIERKRKYLEDLRKQRDELAATVEGHERGELSRLEACSRYYGKLVASIKFHPLVAAIHRAYCDHRPLVLSPDMLWLLVAQGLANHINANPETLRSKFVQHQGKIKLSVRRDDFIKGSPENPWAEAFEEFTDQIRDHIGATTHDLLLPRFSTTGAVERAAAQVTLLDAMQSYFSYQSVTACGIPQIILEGTVDDWRQLRVQTQQLGQFELHWWTDILIPLLDEFVAAAEGQVNHHFWRCIYKLDGGSGGPYTTGWIGAFFPYLKDYKTGRATHKNSCLAEDKQMLTEFLYPPAKVDPYRSGHGLTTEEFPAGLARAPFCWQYLSSEFEMEFLGGFVGVAQDAETLRLRPEIGWAVRECAPSR
jgi:hypothetical protein